jgi:hypothetical protein
MATQPEFVEQLFEAALALEPHRREALLQLACSHDPALRRTVEELLAEDAKAGSLLERPPFAFLGHAETYSRRTGGRTGPIDEHELSLAGRLKPGQILIGRFVIVRYRQGRNG